MFFLKLHVIFKQLFRILNILFSRSQCHYGDVQKPDTSNYPIATCAYCHVFCLCSQIIYRHHCMFSAKDIARLCCSSNFTELVVIDLFPTQSTVRCSVTVVHVCLAAFVAFFCILVRNNN